MVLQQRRDKGKVERSSVREKLQYKKTATGVVGAS